MTPTLADRVKAAAKAVSGALVAGAAAFSTAMQDGSVSGGEWLTIGLAVLAGAGVVYAVPNKPVVDGDQ